MAILVNDVVAYIVIGSRNVYLSIAGDKKHNIQVKKLIDSAYSELSLGQNEFTLELNVPGYYVEGAYITSSKFPTTEKYRVMNFYNESATYLLSEAENEKGVFKNKKFEAIFIDSEVSFTCNEMSDYKNLLDEMTRRFYSEIGRKTKKWIPGHRYDCTETTYYYLGPFQSRKSEEFNSDFCKSDLRTVHLFTNSLRPGETKISDVFKNRCFNIYDSNEEVNKDSIKVYWDEKLPSCVDSGEVLENDSPSLVSLYETMLDNAIKSLDFDTLLDKDIKIVFDPLCYKSESDPYTYPSEVTEKVRTVLSKIIKQTVLDNWDLPRSREDRLIGKDVEFGDNVDRLTRWVFSEISDGNILGKYYYRNLFQELGLDVSKEVTDFLDTWDPSELDKDFDSYLKNIDYFRKRNPRTVINQVIKSQPIDSVFGSTVISDTIKELVEYADSNYGEGVSTYKIDNNKKQLNILCIISIKDLIRFKDSEKLREELLSFKFTEVSLYFDKTKKLE